MKPTTKAAKATKKASAKAPITVEIQFHELNVWALLMMGMSQRKLAEACRVRGIPVAKYKSKMAQRLRDYLRDSGKPIRLVLE